MNEPNKKPYTAPRLRIIKLETKEVMANACKTSTEGEINTGLPSCGLGTQCFLWGS